MLKPRLIPCLLLHKNGLIKTVNFRMPKYVGDPLNAVRIFNERAVDELIVLDIDASVEGVEPNYNLISKLAEQCRMPLCYGGGVKNSSQIEKIISLGVEKVAISSAFISNPNIVLEASRRVGSQSIVVILDIKKSFFKRDYEILINNAEVKSKKILSEIIKEIEMNGAGEIVINSIDRDGTFKGYDFELVGYVKSKTNLPLTILGGASSLSDVKSLWSKFGIVGAAAGSLFVFKGKYRAVLINYPSNEQKLDLYF